MATEVYSGSLRVKWICWLSSPHISRTASQHSSFLRYIILKKSFPVGVISTFSAILYNCRNQRIEVTKCKRRVITFFLILRDFALEDNWFWRGEIFVKSYYEGVKREILPSNESLRSKYFLTSFRRYLNFCSVFMFLYCRCTPVISFPLNFVACGRSACRMLVTKSIEQN